MPGNRSLASGKRLKPRNEVDALLVEVQDTTRQFNAQLDTKFCKLERLIRDADDRIQRLEHLVRMAARLPGCDVTVGDRREALTATTHRHPRRAWMTGMPRFTSLLTPAIQRVEIADQTVGLRPRST